MQTTTRGRETIPWQAHTASRSVSAFSTPRSLLRSIGIRNKAVSVSSPRFRRTSNSCINSIKPVRIKACQSSARHNQSSPHNHPSTSKHNTPTYPTLLSPPNRDRSLSPSCEKAKRKRQLLAPLVQKDGAALRVLILVRRRLRCMSWVRMGKDRERGK